MSFSPFNTKAELTRKNKDSKKTAGEKAQEADAEILEAIKSRRKLASDMELAQGIQYTESLKTRSAILLKYVVLWPYTAFKLETSTVYP